jgi:primosomal protein N'
MLVLVAPEKKSFDDRGLAYSVPSDLREFVKIGSIVIVPFREESHLAIILDIKHSDHKED